MFSDRKLQAMAAMYQNKNLFKKSSNNILIYLLFHLPFFSPLPSLSPPLILYDGKILNEEFENRSSGMQFCYWLWYKRQVTELLLGPIPSSVQQIFVENLPQALFYWVFSGE